MTDFRVFNWNLLSTNLCDPKWHSKCEPKYLETKYRWSLIQSRLEDEIKNNAIICLQELSEEWISLLAPFFIKLGYIFIYDSQWLGVGIAYPRKKFELQGMKMTCIGDTIKKECKPVSKPGWISSIFSFFLALILPKKQDDIWTVAIKKQNRLLGITLKDLVSEKVFKVFTYHMPCAFDKPDLMNIQAVGLLKVVQAEKDIPYVLAGDFNSLRDSDVYRMIVFGIMPHFPISTTYKQTPIFEVNFMNSAYMDTLNKEPLYTNYSHPPFAKEPFRDTIDYIFYGNRLRCISVLPLREDLPESTFPNQEEPSDHLPIGACFQFE